MTFWYYTLALILSLIGMAIGMIAFAFLNQGYWQMIVGREYARLASFPQGVAGYRGLACGIGIGPFLAAVILGHTEKIGTGLILSGASVAAVTLILYISLAFVWIRDSVMKQNPFQESVEQTAPIEGSPDPWAIQFSLMSWEVLMWILTAILMYWGFHVGK